jgi:hypothetical protein
MGVNMKSLTSLFFGCVLAFLPLCASAQPVDPEAIEQVASFVIQVVEFFDTKPDTNIEVLGKLNALLGESKKIEQKIDNLSGQLESAEVSIKSNEDKHWRDWEVSLYNSPIRQYAMEMGSWQSVLSRGGGQTPSKSSTNSHVEVLSTIRRDLDIQLTKVQDFGGTVYAAAIEAALIDDTIRGFEINVESDADLYLLMKQRRIRNLKTFLTYLDDQINSKNTGTIGSQYQLWEGQRLYDDAAFADIDKHYLGNPNIYWWTPTGIPIQDCSCGGSIHGHRTVYATITKNSDGTYAVTNRDGPLIADEHCGHCGGGRSPQLTKLMDNAPSVLSMLGDEARPIPVPSASPISTGIPDPGAGRGADWGNVIVRWNLEVRKMPIIQANALTLKSAVESIVAARNRISKIVAELEGGLLQVK